MQKFYALFAWGFMVLLVLLAQASAALAENTRVYTRNLDVYIQADYCGQGGAICAGATDAASSSNDHVVEVIVHANMANGTSVAGLTENDFSLASITNRGTGVPLVFVSTATCSACFVEVEPGVYRLAIRPSSGNWGEGTYTALLTVTSGAFTRSAVIPIQIPN